MLEFNPQLVVFFLFAILTLGGALGVVTNRNLIHGAVYLIISLFGGAGLFVLLSAPFLAAVQVLVYIGAIAILIIFAVMLTRSMTSMRELFNRQWWASAIVAVLLFGLLVLGVIGPYGYKTKRHRSPSAIWSQPLRIWAWHSSMDEYVLPFELASLLLTAAMIGAIVIAREDD